MNTFVYDAANIALLFGMSGVILFSLLYGLRSRWYRYAEGRALLAKSVSLALVSGLTAAFAVFGEYPYREFARFTVYGLFAVSSWYFTIQLIVSQHRDRAKRNRLIDEFEASKKAEAADAAQAALDALRAERTDTISVRIVGDDRDDPPRRRLRGRHSDDR